MNHHRVTHDTVVAQAVVAQAVMNQAVMNQAAMNQAAMNQAAMNQAVATRLELPRRGSLRDTADLLTCLTRALRTLGLGSVEVEHWQTSSAPGGFEQRGPGTTRNAGKPTFMP